MSVIFSNINQKNHLIFALFFFCECLHTGLNARRRRKADVLHVAVIAFFGGTKIFSKLLRSQRLVNPANRKEIDKKKEKLHH